MTEVYQPPGMRDVDAMVKTIADVLNPPIINIDHWPNSSFVTVGRKRPDNWFCRYSVGKEPPRYPMPAPILDVDIQPDCVAICEYPYNQPGWHEWKCVYLYPEDYYD